MPANGCYRCHCDGNPVKRSKSGAAFICLNTKACRRRQRALYRLRRRSMGSVKGLTV